MIALLLMFLRLFKECSSALRFKVENPTDGALQFLDLRLRIETRHVSWSYEPRSWKGVLPFDSAHSKLVNRAIAVSCMRAALTKSCHHRCESSLQVQFVRLISAGFLLGDVVGIAESLLKKFRSTAGSEVRQKPASRPVVVPYLHALSHNVKSASPISLMCPFFFSAPRKLSRLCTYLCDSSRNG